MNVGYLGPLASYTEQAAQAAFPAAQKSSFPSIDAVFAAVAEGRIDRGVVPFENVIQGPVTETLDHLYAYAGRVKIIDMQVLRIDHALGALDKNASISRLVSKDQALKQCSVYLQNQHPQAQHVAVSSTTAAMQMIVEGAWQDAAAVGSAAALRSYGLQIIAEHIGNVPSNKTRFVVLGAAGSPAAARTGQDATALVIYPHHDRVGLLQWILTIISHDHRLSCSSIHSRPDTQGAFRFYLEIEGHLDDTNVAACLDTLGTELRRHDADMHVFGAYPRRSFIERRLKCIGILGGTGAMGQWLARFFTEAGYDVLVSGRTTALTYRQCVAAADAIIVNVPISVTEAVIDEIAPWLRPGQLLADNTSVKTQPVAAMLRGVAPGVEVLGMHTVFGPSVTTLRHQNVIFTRTPASGPLADELEAAFHKYGARISHTSPQVHDQQMAFHQNLEHFTKVVLAEVLCQNFATDAQRYSSPNSRVSLATLGRILSGDPALYAEIQTANAAGPGAIALYLEVANRLGAALAGGDVQGLKDSMVASRKTLGEAFLLEQLAVSKKLLP